MISRKDARYYLVQVDENGDEMALQKTWNGAGFIATSMTANAHMFKTEDDVKNACKLQQMMNAMFGINTKTYYMKETTERVRYDETGAVAEDTTEEPTEDNPAAE